MKILFASDISFNFVNDLSKETAEKCLKDTSVHFRNADFSMINLENIFGVKENLTPIKKSGPNLISLPESINYVNVLRPTVIGLANNHTRDFGDEAMLSTIDTLKNEGYTVIGAGKNIDEAYNGALLEKEGVSAYIIPVCENEFGIAEHDTAGTAGFSLGRVTKAIFSAKEKGYLPIIYFHGGNENYAFPAPSKKELYRHFVDLGAAAVIAMHTHCPQGYEFYNGSPIVYSMGNFYFPGDFGSHKVWFNGYMSLLDISESGIKLDIIPFKFENEKHTVLTGNEKEEFMKYMDYINSPISDDRLLAEYFDSWCIISGIEGGYINGMQYNEKMLQYDPSINVARTKNVITCEAHTELMRNTFKIIFEQRLDSARSKIDEINVLQDMKIPN